MLEDTRIINCPACGGDPEIEHLTGYNPFDGSPLGWIERCDYCHGTGVVVEELEPIEMEDLPDA